MKLKFLIINRRYLHCQGCAAILQTVACDPLCFGGAAMPLLRLPSHFLFIAPRVCLFSFL